MSIFDGNSGVRASEDGKHVYVRWFTANPEGKGVMTVIGMHPEIASAPTPEQSGQMDETTRICHEFAVRNNFATLALVNLYSQVGLDQNNIRKATQPSGPENDIWIAAVASASDMIVAAWGDFPWIKFRSRQIMTLLGPFHIHAVQVNSNGTPSHPKAWRMKAAKMYRQGNSKAVPAAG